MRILRGLSSRFLWCGCLVGIYETYEAEVVGIIDVRGRACPEPEHAPDILLGLADPDVPGDERLPYNDPLGSTRNN